MKIFILTMLLILGLCWLVPQLRNRTILRVLAPGYGTCERCAIPWKFADNHMTTFVTHEPPSAEEIDEEISDGGAVMFIVSSGGFCLCESCWSKLTPEERLPYYRTTWLKYWQDSDNKDWDTIEQAVLNGG